MDTNLLSHAQCSQQHPPRRMPVTVLVVDDDCYAFQWMAAIFGRDPRTRLLGEVQVIATAQKLGELLAGALKLIRSGKPDLIVAALDTADPRVPPARLAATLRAAAPQAVLVCLLKAPTPALIQAALAAEADAIFLKDEALMALVPAALRAQRGGLLISEGVETALSSLSLRAQRSAQRLPTWRPNPHLTRRPWMAFILCVLFGLRNRSAADKMTLVPETIEKYASRTYDVLNHDDWADDSDLAGLDLEGLQPEERAFLWYTALPRKRG